jgi:O-antigen biosynthesis protein WbqV
MTILRRLTRPATLAFYHDTVMAALAFLAGLYLRLGSGMLDRDPQVLVGGTVLFTGVAICVFLATRLNRGVWRYASLNDVFAILRAASLIVLVTVLALFLVTRGEEVPRSSLVFSWFVLVLFLAAPRLAYRALKDRQLRSLLSRGNEASRIPVLLVGAGDEADLFIREMARRADAPYRVVGIIDDRARRIGQSIRGVPVLGGVDDMPRLVERQADRGDAVQRLIVARRDVGPEELRRLLDIGDQLALPLSRLPRLTDFHAGENAPVEVRPVALEDLLGRAQTALDRNVIAGLVAGRRVLVTGAGGTIGGELVRQLAALAPQRLALLDHSEYALYTIDLELTEAQAPFERVPYLADVRDRDRLDEIFRAERPDLVFHAAALKHVPMVESNPEEGILTNVIGTRNVADLARLYGVAAMVLISTDKAVNPSSVMGASKRLAEAWCQTLDTEECRRIADTGSGTRFVTVRFGNVLGSTGSVVPLFQRQLAAGGPLTVTHPDIQRYFMTVREAVELVLHASSLGVGDPQAGGKIFVLDMGEPVKIVDLARQMIRLAGLKPDQDVAITFTGLRPGEKLNEQLFHHNEPLVETVLKGIQLASPRPHDAGVLADEFDRIEDAARGRRKADALQLLQRLVPEYQGGEPDQVGAPVH